MKKPKDQDVHTQMIEYFIEYSYYNNRFMLYGYKENSIKARSALTKIAKLARRRRQEIGEDRKALYSGENTAQTEVAKRVQDRMNRKAQKDKAKDDTDTT